MSRPSFPPTTPVIRHRRPFTGSSGASSPASSVPCSAPTPAAHPAALRCLRLAVPRWARYSLPGEGEPACRGLGLCSPGGPPGGLRGDDRISWVPGEPHCTHAPLFDHGGERCPSPSRDIPCCLPLDERRRPPQKNILTRLHHAAYVPPVYASQRRSPVPPRNTRFPLPARLYGAGFDPAGLR